MKSIYTPLKIFHYKEKLDSLSKEKDILPPIHIRIKPTNRCNHNCRYCAYRVDNLQLGKDMRLSDEIPREKMIEIINDIIDMGVKAITFSGGGEPLIYPYLAESIKALAKSSISIAALTNGSKLNGEIAKQLSENATWIRVSMDGWDDESYRHYRKAGNNEYTLIMNNMESFKKLSGKCVLGVSLIIDENNHDKIYQQVKRLKDLGVDNVKISPCIVNNSGRLNNEYHKSFFTKAKQEAQKAKKDLEDNNFEVFDSYHELDEKFDKDYTWCPYIQILTVVGADLNIYSCQDKAYNMDNGLVGSIKIQSFKKFWFNNESKFFKINPSMDCQHHCVANKKNQLVFNYLDCDKNHLAFV